MDGGAVMDWANVDLSAFNKVLYLPSPDEELVTPVGASTAVCASPASPSAAAVDLGTGAGPLLLDTDHLLDGGAAAALPHPPSTAGFVPTPDGVTSSGYEPLGTLLDGPCWADAAPPPPLLLPADAPAAVAAGLAAAPASSAGDRGGGPAGGLTLTDLTAVEGALDAAAAAGSGVACGAAVVAELPDLPILEWSASLGPAREAFVSGPPTKRRSLSSPRGVMELMAGGGGNSPSPPAPPPPPPPPAAGVPLAVLSAVGGTADAAGVAGGILSRPDSSVVAATGAAAAAGAPTRYTPPVGPASAFGGSRFRAGGLAARRDMTPPLRLAIPASAALGVVPPPRRSVKRSLDGDSAAVSAAPAPAPVPAPRASPVPPSPSPSRTSAPPVASSPPTSPLAVGSPAGASSAAQPAGAVAAVPAGGTPTTAAPAKRIRKRVRSRKAADRSADAALPSRFCHVCSRVPKQSSHHIVCANIRGGGCRKTVCERCFAENGWDWSAAVAKGSAWICPHCADGDCPPRAQCHTYARTNGRRRGGGEGEEGGDEPGC
ncbi:hypothetical protein MMPV_007639 [Pyropia vietnamensis]